MVKSITEELTLDPAKLPVGTLAVIAIGSVENIKAFKTSDKRWTFSEAPDLGLNDTWTTNATVQVQRVLESNEEVTPSRRPYDVENMTARQLETALEEVLGENEEDGGDYYSDYSGLNGFYHRLAGTYDSSAYSAEKVDDEEKYTISDSHGLVLTVPALGVFEAVEKNTEYEAETGDADVKVVFKFNGRYFQKQGNLDSYEGGYFDGRLTEVKPVERLVTFWESV